MKNKFTTAKNTLTNRESSLAPLFSHARKLEKLSEFLSLAIPEPLNRHCRLINVRENTLIFLADSPVWAQKLKLMSKEILKSAAYLYRAEKISIRINTDLPRPTAAAPEPRSLSPHASNTLLAAASICSDPELAEQMQRLARQAANSVKK